MGNRIMDYYEQVRQNTKMLETIQQRVRLEQLRRSFQPFVEQNEFTSPKNESGRKNQSTQVSADREIQTSFSEKIAELFQQLRL
jgi:hypothetical protein